MQVRRHVSCQPQQLETDYAVDHPFLHRPSFRIRNHDVHREPLNFSGFIKKRTGAQRVRFFHSIRYVACFSRTLEATR